MTREERLDWLCRLRSDISYMNFSIDVEVSLERKKQYRQVLSEVIKTLEQESTTKIEESNFSQEQYKADIQSAYDCGKSVIDKIRAEIEEIQTYDGIYIDRAYVLEIIDKHKAESEVKDGYDKNI